MRNNVPRLSIYTLDIYSTLLAAQAIFNAVAWASSYLACIPSYLKIVSYGPRHLESSTLSLKSLGLYSKSSKDGTLCPKVPPPPCYNFLEASRT
jgi:hypothetical protein